MRSAEAVCVLILICGCREAAPVAPPKPAAKVANARPEGALSTVTLSEDAERRLGIVLSPAERRRVPASLVAPGEVALPPGRSLVVSAPLAGTVSSGTVLGPGTPVAKGDVVLRLVPLPSATELASAQIRVEAARKRRDRARELVKDGAGSQRSLEEADAELAMAEANAGAGSGGKSESPTAMLAIRAPQAGMIRDLHVGAGQAVAAGAPLFQIDSQSNLWIRTQVYVGDVPRVDRAASSQVRGLSSAPASVGFEALPISGPPTGNPEAASEDLYFQLPAPTDAGVTFRPGQRVSVRVPLTERGEALVIPWSAVLFDLSGSTWVYVLSAPHTYARQKVQLREVLGDRAVIDRGLAEAQQVVAVGAEELFGTEFGTGK